MINLVPDKEICQEAFKKGIKIESKFWWVFIAGGKGKFELLEVKDFIKKDFNTSFPAPLTDEILQVLPWHIVVDVSIRLLTINKIKDLFIVGYPNGFEFKDKKLSNALLSLAIKLKDENII